MATVVRSRSRSRPNALRFGPGDRALVAHLGRVRWSLLDDLAIAVGRPPAKVRQRLALLRHDGLVDYDRPSAGAGTWRATRAGLQAAGLAGPAARSLWPSGWLHATTLAALCAALSASGLDYLSEYELRRELVETQSAEQRGQLAVMIRQGTRWRVPDIRLDTGQGLVAVELELHAKSYARLVEILQGHAFAGWRVLYLAPPQVARVIEEAAARIGAAVRAELRLRVMPAPVLAAAGARPARPDPVAAAAIVAEICRRGRVAASVGRDVEVGPADGSMPRHAA